jgi:CheY-like chemotaxis protein
VNDVEILLVDDSPIDAELAMRALKKAGLKNKLLWVKDGQEALDYLFRQGQYASRDETLPRLVLLDLNMPKVGGIDVVQAVKTNDRTKSIPLVVMTASQEESDLGRTYGMGVNSYIVKALDFDALSEVVAKTAHYWLVINHTPGS